jgi:pimeloyl-ACP methyl ester carboxylesterase
LVVLALLSGCGGRRLLLNGQNLDHGLVIVLPGIDGLAPYNINACKALCDDHFGMAVELYDWTLPFGLLINQCAILRNRLAADELAHRILEYRKKYPNRPVFLIGHSGGTAIAVWAAEDMPEEERIDGIVLLGSSLSPQYDLTKAIGHTRTGIVNFYSYQDEALLGVGTVLLGTMDGQHTESAGKVGFHRARGGEAPYAGLVQIAWHPAMAVAGHDGGHFGYTAPGFMKSHVRPWLAGPGVESSFANAPASPSDAGRNPQAGRLAMGR